MSDVTVERVREREPEPASLLDRFEDKQHRRRHRALEGRIVMRRDEMVLEQNRQGLIRWFLNSQEDPDDVTAESATDCWDVFTHDIRTNSGMHRHQGGLVIYVVSGKGHTVVENTRVDWEAGDLLLLPIQPGGVAHQHFNDEDGSEPVQWVALIYRPMHDAMGAFLEQIVESPDFAG